MKKMKQSVKDFRAKVDYLARNRTREVAYRQHEREHVKTYGVSKYASMHR